MSSCRFARERLKFDLFLVNIQYRAVQQPEGVFYSHPLS